MGRDIKFPPLNPNGFTSVGNRRGFIAPEILARIVDFDALQVLNLNEEGQKVTLSDKSLKDLLEIKVPDPKDDTYVAEGRPQRKISKTVNLADATLTLSDKMNAIATAMTTGNTDTLSGVQALRTAVENIYASASGEYRSVMRNVPVGALAVFKEALKQIQLPAQAVDNGFQGPYYTINEIKAAPAKFGPYLDQTIDPDNTSILKITKSGAEKITFDELLKLNNDDWILNINLRQVRPRVEVSIPNSAMSGVLGVVPANAPGASTIAFQNEPQPSASSSQAGPSGLVPPIQQSTATPPPPPKPKTKKDKLMDEIKSLNDEINLVKNTDVDEANRLSGILIIKTKALKDELKKEEAEIKRAEEQAKMAIAKAKHDMALVEAIQKRKKKIESDTTSSQGTAPASTSSTTGDKFEPTNAWGKLLNHIWAKYTLSDAVSGRIMKLHSFLTDNDFLDSQWDNIDNFLKNAAQTGTNLPKGITTQQEATDLRIEILKTIQNIRDKLKANKNDNTLKTLKEQSGFGKKKKKKTKCGRKIDDLMELYM